MPACCRIRLAANRCGYRPGSRQDRLYYGIVYRPDTGFLLPCISPQILVEYMGWRRSCRSGSVSSVRQGRRRSSVWRGRGIPAAGRAVLGSAHSCRRPIGGGCQRPAVLFLAVPGHRGAEPCGGTGRRARGSHGRGLPGSVRCHPVLRYPVGRRRLYVPDSGAKACIQPDFCSHHPVLRVGVLHHRRVAVEPVYAGIPARQPRHPAVGVCGLCLHSGGNRAFPAEFPESGENGCTQQYRASCGKIDGRQKLT